MRSSRIELSIGGVPLRVSMTFLAVAIVFGWFSGRVAAHAQFVHLPRASGPAPEDWRAYGEWLQTHPLAYTVTHPSPGWVLAAGLGVAVAYCLSVLAHELGHFIAAQAVKVDVVAVELNLAGGFVEMHDDDRLTAGRLAAIVGAGPFVSAIIAFIAWAALNALDWPLTGTPDVQSGAEVTAGCILSFAFLINASVVLLNLLPFRILDGGQLLVAARLRARRQGW